MKIGVLTLPLQSNYGGVLQAYALQYSLRSMGHEAYLIDCRVDPKYLNLIKYPIAYSLALISKLLPSAAVAALAPLERQMRADKVIMRRNMELFIERNIQLRHYLSLSLIPKSHFEAIVVGSDQVWRPAYFEPIESAYLSFAKRWSIKRVAYAASFGVDHWEYSELQTERCRSLAAAFDSISLRERSGVELARTHLEREATVVLDPTMLLSRDHYSSLAARCSTCSSDGDMMVTILDDSDDKRIMVRALESHFGVTSFSVNSRFEDRSAPLEERIQPPVEQWLCGFQKARYVVTDSFHSMVFAIIFNKPFVVYANLNRGATRFLSLLSLLGLESQIITESNQLNLESCFAIEWDDVNRRLEALREQSLTFLSRSLG